MKKKVWESGYFRAHRNRTNILITVNPPPPLYSCTLGSCDIKNDIKKGMRCKWHRDKFMGRLRWLRKNMREIILMWFFINRLSKFGSFQTLVDFGLFFQMGKGNTSFLWVEFLIWTYCLLLAIIFRYRIEMWWNKIVLISDNEICWLNTNSESFYGF